MGRLLAVRGKQGGPGLTRTAWAVLAPWPLPASPWPSGHPSLSGPKLGSELCSGLAQVGPTASLAPLGGRLFLTPAPAAGGGVLPGGQAPPNGAAGNLSAAPLTWVMLGALLGAFFGGFLLSVSCGWNTLPEPEAAVASPCSPISCCSQETTRTRPVPEPQGRLWPGAS